MSTYDLKKRVIENDYLLPEDMTKDTITEKNVI